MWITDSNGVRLKVEYNWWFHQGAIIKTETGKTLHNSEVTKAHNICHSKTCHHLMNGKIYKCGAVALFPEFDQQHKFDISDEDRAILNSYRPLSPWEYPERGADFLDTIDEQLTMCKFCPESLEYKNRLFAVTKNQARKQYTLEPVV